MKAEREEREESRQGREMGKGTQCTIKFSWKLGRNIIIVSLKKKKVLLAKNITYNNGAGRRLEGGKRLKITPISFVVAGFK